MRVASVAEVKAKLSTYLKEAKESGPVVITRNGRAVAVILAPVDDDDLEHLLLSRAPRFQALLNKSRESIRAGRAVSHEEFWKNVQQRSADSANTEGRHQ
jgi:prevent-host-death family protein